MEPTSFQFYGNFVFLKPEHRLWPWILLEAILRDLGSFETILLLLWVYYNFCRMAGGGIHRWGPVAIKHHIQKQLICTMKWHSELVCHHPRLSQCPEAREGFGKYWNFTWGYILNLSKKFHLHILRFFWAFSAKTLRVWPLGKSENMKKGTKHYIWDLHQNLVNGLSHDV